MVVSLQNRGYNGNRLVTEVKRGDLGSLDPFHNDWNLEGLSNSDEIKENYTLIPMLASLFS